MQNRKNIARVTPVKAYLVSPLINNGNEDSTTEPTNPPHDISLGGGGFWCKVTSWKPAGIFTEFGYYPREWIRSIKIYGNTDKFCVPGMASFIHRFWFLTKYTMPTIRSMGSKIVSTMRKTAKKSGAMYSQFVKKGLPSHRPLDPGVRCAMAGVKRQVTHLMHAVGTALADNRAIELPKEPVNEPPDTIVDDEKIIDKLCAYANRPRHFYRSYTQSMLEEELREYEEPTPVTKPSPPVVRPIGIRAMVTDPSIVFCLHFKEKSAVEYLKMLVSTKSIVWSDEIAREHLQAFKKNVINIKHYCFEHFERFERLAKYLGIDNWETGMEKVHNKKIGIKQMQSQEKTKDLETSFIERSVLNRRLRQTKHQALSDLDQEIYQATIEHDNYRTAILKRERMELKKT